MQLFWKNGHQQVSNKLRIYPEVYNKQCIFTCGSCISDCGFISHTINRLLASVNDFFQTLSFTFSISPNIIESTCLTYRKKTHVELTTQRHFEWRHCDLKSNWLWFVLCFNHQEKARWRREGWQREIVGMVVVVKVWWFDVCVKPYRRQGTQNVRECMYGVCWNHYYLYSYLVNCLVVKESLQGTIATGRLMQRCQMSVRRVYLHCIQIYFKLIHRHCIFITTNNCYNRFLRTYIYFFLAFHLHQNKTFHRRLIFQNRK